MYFKISQYSDIEASTTNIENLINSYKLELPDINYIFLTFNVKDLRPYHGENLRTNIFSQLGRLM